MSGARTATALLLLALGATGCAHSLGGDASPRPRLAPAAAPTVRVTTSAEVLRGIDRHASPFDDPVLAEVLGERLAARGFRAVAGPEDGEPPPRRWISLWALGSRRTNTTRLLGVPWGLVCFASLGFVPYRHAREYVFEVRSVDPDAAPPERVRISRRSYTLVSWVWTPLLLGRGTSPSPTAAGKHAESRERAVHREGLARAIDRTLDDVLAADAR